MLAQALERDDQQQPAEHSGRDAGQDLAPHQRRHGAAEADDRRQERDARARPLYSHSIVPGGLDVMSRTTRLTSRISPIMREAICSSRS